MNAPDRFRQHAAVSGASVFARDAGGSFYHTSSKLMMTWLRHHDRHE